MIERLIPHGKFNPVYIFLEGVVFFCGWHTAEYLFKLVLDLFKLR